MSKLKERLLYLHGMMEAFEKLDKWVTSPMNRRDLKKHQQSCQDEIKQISNQININEFLNNKK